MKIQGVEILRITDFCRFFDMEEFLADKDHYIKFFMEVDNSLFCNTVRDSNLLGGIRAWLTGKDLNATFSDCQVSISDSIWLPLGGIEKVLSQFRDTLPYRDRIGLAYLFLLLKDSWDSDRMLKACETFRSFSSREPIGDYMPVTKNSTFERGESATIGVKAVYIGNTLRDAGVTVTCGHDKVTLMKGEAVVGLFNGSGKCFRLLPNKSVSDNGKIQMILKVDLETKLPFVEYKKGSETEKLTDVTSFWIEAGNYPVYLTKEGKLIFDDSCFSLKKSYGKEKEKYPDRKLIAAESKNGFYTFYYR